MTTYQPPGPTEGEVVNMDGGRPSWLPDETWCLLRDMHQGRRLRVQVSDIIHDSVSLRVEWEDGK